MTETTMVEVTQADRDAANVAFDIAFRGDTFGIDDAMAAAFARHRIAALSTRAPDGMVVVSREPTEAMLTAGTDQNAAIMLNYDNEGWRSITGAIWSAMIAAAPEAK